MAASILTRWKSLLSSRKAANPIQLHEADYTVLDTETTGFAVGKDHILSIGLVRMNQGRILLKDSIEIIINGAENLGSSPAIHGITQEQLENGVDEKTAIDLFEKAVKGTTLVAHYARFDREMLAALFAKNDRLLPSNTWLDTMDIQVALEPQREGRAELLKLDELLHHYKIDALRRHTALGDAYSTARVLQHQLAELKNANVLWSNQLAKKRIGLL